MVGACETFIAFGKASANLARPDFYFRLGK
jgi:hypothetical protein